MRQTTSILILATWLILQPSTSQASDIQPSEKAKTAAFATGAGDSATPPAKSGQSGKKIEILFGGSLCPVCLVAFEKRLAATEGVVSVHVEALNTTKHTGHPPKRAQALIEFLPEKITQARLIEMVKNNDFAFLKAQELPADNK